MKATGMVRRMDELGRVVIPKEMRRTMHLHEGEELEIFAHEEGLLLKKYSALSALEGWAQRYVASLQPLLHSTLMVADCDSVLAAVGGAEVGALTQSALGLMQQRAPAAWTTPMAVVRGGRVWPCGALCPLVAHGDLYGALVLGDASPIDLRQTVVLQTAAAILAQQLGG